MLNKLTLPHFLLTLSVVAIWGSNFIVIQAAHGSMTPLLFATLRFAISFFPVALLLPRPKVPWSELAAYGLLIAGGQFCLIYAVMNAYISAGLASLVVQTQVFFTIGLAVICYAEKPAKSQYIALAIASLGMAIIVMHSDGTTTNFGIVLTLIAAATWAAANMVTRRSNSVSMVAYVSWSSLFAIPVLILLTLWFDGSASIEKGIFESGPSAWAAVMWQAGAVSLFGNAVWAWLLGRYTAASLTPMVLLVPVFGMSGSAWLLGEEMPDWKLASAALIIGGLLLNIVWGRLQGAKDENR